MSVFTFDPDPPRVSSPWLRPEDSDRSGRTERSPTPAAPAPGLLSEYGVTKLPPEPQEGPTEYKLHLLLRPRRKYRFISTATSIAGSQHSRSSLEPPEPKVYRPRLSPAAGSGQARQDRCQQLTTQLLWRLRQSTPYHSSTSYQEIVASTLPDDSSILTCTPVLAKVAPGLEESRGALYEIGVADDGTFIGITKDELDQSVATLRWMAANLGCVVEVLRRVVVGECEWAEEPPLSTEGQPPKMHKEKLWVAEALVQPDLTSRAMSRPDDPSDSATAAGDQVQLPSVSRATTDQLRVTLTGATTSGKSSLLGTLSTGALDDGHGKSRLNSLKHRHELESGLTSSVTQELLGYRDNAIMNYANPNIESWIGIHDYTKDGRLVLVSDSAGHPRYRRTTLRGIVGWAPHWTILCMAGDNTDTGAAGATPTLSAHDAFGVTIAGLDLARAHLDLCLKLELPLVIVITKADVLSKDSLKRLLLPIWTAVKKAGRMPQFLQSKVKAAENLREVSATDNSTIRTALAPMAETGNFLATVPVILTSAVNGEGIGLMHALMQSLPLPPPPTSHDFTGQALNPEQPVALFHIDDKFSLPASYASVSTEDSADSGTVVAGHLRFGRLSLGDRLVVGPFPSGDDDLRGLTPDRHPSPGNFGLSISHPSSSELSRIALRNAVSAATIKGEWHTARVVSIRNLRLPVQTLEAGQVGTIGLIFNEPKEDAAGTASARQVPSMPKLRKGMVLAIPSRHMEASGLQLQAASGLTAYFDDANIAALAVGMGVTFYVASVRAQARVLGVSGGKRYNPGDDDGDGDGDDDDGGVFTLNDSPPRQASPPTGFHVRLELLYGREWIELGSPIFILEGANKDGSVLDGFIGRVLEIVD